MNKIIIYIAGIIGIFLSIFKLGENNAKSKVIEKELKDRKRLDEIRKNSVGRKRDDIITRMRNRNK